MEIQKITITRSDALGDFSTDINWELLDKALASLAMRLGRERSLKVEIQAVRLPADYGATLAMEGDYLPEFRRHNGRVKFLDPKGANFSFPEIVQKPVLLTSASVASTSNYVCTAWTSRYSTV